MANFGKCPKCENIPTSVRIEPIQGNVSRGNGFHCLSYCCPICNTILGVEIDPIAVKGDIISGVVRELRGY